MGAQASLFTDAEPPLHAGLSLFRSYLDASRQTALLDEVAGVLREAPPYRPQMKMGAYIINHISNCGQWGWHADARGYRYVDAHPETGKPWPAIPPLMMQMACAAAAKAGRSEFVPDACLINIYAADGKLNLHQDHDEADFSWPIVSFSFGNDCIFLAGGRKRRDPVSPLTLSSGDVMVMDGAARMLFHGVRRILAGTSTLSHPALPPQGRINLTFRRAK
ncbi:MAG TPA: alpha-ketoglutarate-dependent dioxygenase AlkB [Micropepsaceae bacterium]|nr:alpha-ketoglutarate-dependent dioxygenase AlkB [Micropepsaceae bacterium]